MKFAVIGWPLGHSLSPVIYNAAFKHLGLRHTFVALPSKDGIKALANGYEQGFKGFAVTIPHKVNAALKSIRLDPAARLLGAVNTVLFTRDGIVGANTDVPAVQAALGHLGPRKKGPSLILGSGGAARAGALALANERFTPVSVVARSAYRGRKILQLLKARERGRVRLWTRKNLLKAMAETSVLYQATPIGMSPKVKASPVPRIALRPDLGICETVYNPKRTLLIQDAEKAGCTTIEGRVMFLEQAVLQFKLLTGRRAPRVVMAKALEKALKT